MRNLPVLVLCALISMNALAAVAVYPAADAIRAQNNSSVKIVAIGDYDHEKRSIRDTIANALAIYKSNDPSFDCLYLEIDARMQTAFNKYNQSLNPDYSATIVSALLSIDPELKKRGVQADYQLNIMNESLLSRAKALNIKVRAGDIDFSSELGQKVRALRVKSLASQTQQEAILEVQERSRNFVDRVDSDLSSGVCHKAIAIFGGGHFLPKLLNFYFITIQQFLEKKSIPYFLAAAESLECGTTKHPVRRGLCQRMDKGEEFVQLETDSKDPNVPSLIFLAK